MITVSGKMEENSCQPKIDSFGPDSSDCVDGLSPTAEPNEEVDVSDSETESEDEVEHEREAIPDGDTNADSRALLDLSKSRLQKQPQVGDEDATSNNENDMVPEGADELIVHGRGHVEGKSIEPDEASPVIKDQAYYIELAMKDRNEAEVKAKDEGAEYLRRVTEEKVEQVEKPKQDDDVAAEGAHSLSTREADTSQSQQSQALLPPKATLSRGPARSENQELWALLNYSKKRLETGATPQIKKKGSVRGDDVSVSSKLSKSSKASKRSLGSKTSTTRTADIAIVGGPDNLASPLGSSDRATGKTDAPFNNVTDNGDASVDGSVSLDSETKISDRSDNSDDEEETSSDEEQEEEDELPDFLQDNDIDKTDPEETKLLYEGKIHLPELFSFAKETLILRCVGCLSGQVQSSINSLCFRRQTHGFANASSSCCG